MSLGTLVCAHVHAIHVPGHRYPATCLTLASNGPLAGWGNAGNGVWDDISLHGPARRLPLGGAGTANASWGGGAEVCGGDSLCSAHCSPRGLGVPVLRHRPCLRQGIRAHALPIGTHWELIAVKSVSRSLCFASSPSLDCFCVCSTALVRESSRKAADYHASVEAQEESTVERGFRRTRMVLPNPSNMALIHLCSARRVGYMLVASQICWHFFYRCECRIRPMNAAIGSVTMLSA